MRYFSFSARKSLRVSKRFFVRDRRRSGRFLSGSVLNGGKFKYKRKRFHYFVFAHKKFILSDYGSMLSLFNCIYGIGGYRSFVLCVLSRFGSLVRPSVFSPSKLFLADRVLRGSGFLYGRLLLNFFAKSVRRVCDSGSYRGRRLVYRLPVRGQRTRSNARSPKKVRLVGL